MSSSPCGGPFLEFPSVTEKRLFPAFVSFLLFRSVGGGGVVLGLNELGSCSGVLVVLCCELLGSDFIKKGSRAFPCQARKCTYFVRTLSVLASVAEQVYFVMLLLAPRRAESRSAFSVLFSSGRAESLSHCLTFWSSGAFRVAYKIQ